MHIGGELRDASGAIELAGFALHRGGPASVRLRVRPGPIGVVQRGVRARLADLEILRADAGVCLASRDAPGLEPARSTSIRLDLVEHLLAAVGGLGIDEGLSIETDDAELPLLDGGAARFCSALDALGPWPTRSRARRRVVRAARFEHGTSSYELAPADGVHVAVSVEFPPPVGAQRAAWDGDRRDFVDRIAPARTFGWMEDHAELLARGRAVGAAPHLERGLLVFSRGGGVVAGAPAGDEECARHKLLDLVGDLVATGGAPCGRIRAHRPGHSATQAMAAWAVGAGVIEVSS